MLSSARAPRVRDMSMQPMCHYKSAELHDFNKTKWFKI
jgi:hypothetical protein